MFIYCTVYFKSSNQLFIISVTSRRMLILVVWEEVGYDIRVGKVGAASRSVLIMILHEIISGYDRNRIIGLLIFVVWFRR